MTLKKISQNRIDVLSLMSSYVNHLRAMYLINQNNHWKISGESFYGNHLLFQRVYESLQEMIDEAAEKCVGICGDVVTGDISGIVDKYTDYKDNTPNKLLKISLDIENDFQKIAKETYEKLKDSGTLTLGLDDMIMSHASKSEVHLYLLQQALK